MTIGHSLFRQTVVAINPSKTLIRRKDEMVWMGSCFVQNMEPFLTRFQYSALVNPLGVVFHPIVMLRLLEMNANEILEKSFEGQSVWKNYWLAATFSGSETSIANAITQAVQIRNVNIKKAGWLVLTMGTAFWYQHKQLGLVGKCHKQAGNLFEKRRSDLTEIVVQFKQTIENLRIGNPELKVILTVSPVRHTRDGLAENSVSKSILRLACLQLCEEVDQVFYFPAFEIVMDELRDYRFFGPDLVHPTEEAVAYIWSRFEEQFFSTEDRETNRQIQSYLKLKSHKPLVDFGFEFERWQQELDHQSAQISSRIELGF
ncbi:MAG TPA: GSCFA domain-containing protein [Catalimonadaceae bacterium]|nr:GSCFA domain-containing protein [Catalimonadaceae bacterium]